MQTHPRQYRIQIIGMGKMGSAIAYSLMLTKPNLHLILTEFHADHKKEAYAEYLDLKPVAISTDNFVEMAPYIDRTADAYVLTAGVPRRHSKESKAGLAEQNIQIALKVCKDIPRRKPIFVVSNPPVQIARALREADWRKVIALRQCTDTLRELTFRERATEANAFVLDNKGHTCWTPAYACAQAIAKLKVM